MSVITQSAGRDCSGGTRGCGCAKAGTSNAEMSKSCPLHRLNYRLSMACHETIQDKCADACVSKSVDQPCGGTVLRCLTEKMEEITDAECKKEVFYFVKMEARAPPAACSKRCCIQAHACMLLH